MLPDAFRRLKPIYGAKIDQLWIEYQSADGERKREIDELITTLAVRKLGMALGEEKLLLDPPPEGLIGRGEYAVGEVSYPSLGSYPWRVGRNELLRHCFLLGPTGTGKSTLILRLLEELLRDGQPFIAFDFKRNYRCLLRSSLGSGVVVLSLGREVAPAELNAMQPPPGIGFEEWVEGLSDIICESYLLLHGARSVLKESLLAARREHGDGASLRDAHALLAAELEGTKAGSRRYGWLESATRSLEELTKGAFGRALCAVDPVPLSWLLSTPVVFELEGLGDDQKRFFCLYMLHTVLLFRKTESAPREVLRHVLVFDEAHHVFPRERPGEVGIPARLAREVREYGESIIAATQQADVSESLLANTGIKIVLRCDFPRDVQFASALMQVDGKWMSRMPIGTGLARLPVRYYQPFLFTYPPTALKNFGVSDAQVQERWNAMLGMTPTVPPGCHRPLTLLPRREAKPAALSEKEETLLRDVNDHPIAGITQRYERLGWHPQVGNEVKDRLITRGFVRFDPVNTGRGYIKVLSLTTDGRAALQSRGVDTTRIRHGGAEHEYWKATVKRKLEQLGWTVTEEAPLGGGKTVDLLAVRAEKSLYVEVETGRSDVAANAAKLNGLPGQVVFLLTPNADAAAITPRLPPGIEVLLSGELEQLENLTGFSHSTRRDAS